MNIIGYITILVTCIIIWVLYRKARQEEIYINTKTGKKYRGVGIVKMKDPLSLKWMNAILYISFKDGNYYVREEEQFFDRFITLKEWEENGNGSKS